AAQRPAGEVVVEDVPAAVPPAAAGVLERADQLLLLGIDADHGQAPRQIPAPYPGQVAELPVPVGVARPRQALAVGPQGEALLLEQAGQGAMADGQPALAQGRTQLADRLVRPPHPRHRVTGDGVAQQVLQGHQDVRTFLFFDPLSAATGSVDTSHGTLVGVGQLALAPPDGISAQAGDAGETGDAASAMLLGQQASDQAPALLVQGSDQVVQGVMLFGRGPIGLTATAGAAMDNGRFTCPIHDLPPPWAVDQGPEVLYGESTMLLLGAPLVVAEH